jgi:hypothetical protein
MSNVRNAVFQFIERVRTRPVDATDPRVLSTLEEAARNDWGGQFVAVNSPVAPLTGEQRAILRSTAQQSERLNFVMPYPLEILGMFPTVVQSAAGALLTPTADLIDVSLDVNLDSLYTQANGISTPAGQQGGSFVTLSALNSSGGNGNAGRQFGVRLTQPNPNIGFTFRWKLGASTCIEALIGIALFTRRIG